MAKHGFGLMARAPVCGERYDRYEPEKYALLHVDDEFIEPLLSAFSACACFWHSLDVPGKGLAYCGITLIPPELAGAMAELIEGPPELRELGELLQRAQAQGKYVIHYGL